MDSRAYVLLYDRDCGICSAVSRFLRAVDFRRRIRVQTIQSSLSLIRHIPEDRALDAFHVVRPDGRTTTGGEALPTLIEAFPLGAGFAGILRGSDVLMSAVHAFYRFLAQFRERLVCGLAPAARLADSGPRRGNEAP